MGILFFSQAMISDLRSYISANSHSVQPILQLPKFFMIQRTRIENKDNLRMLRIVQCCYLHCQLRTASFFTMCRIFTLPCLPYCFVVFTVSSALYCFPPHISSFSHSTFSANLRARIFAGHWLYNSKQDRHVLSLQRLNSCLFCMFLKIVFYDFHLNF